MMPIRYLTGLIGIGPKRRLSHDLFVVCLRRMEIEKDYTLA